MNLIVTTSSKSYPGWVALSSLRELSGYTGNVLTLVIASLPRVDLEDLEALSAFVKRTSPNLVYISSSMDISLKFSVMGLKGYCLEDEFYLSDAETLNSCAKTIREGRCKNTYDMLMGDINVLKSFISTDILDSLPAIQRNTVINSLNSLVSYATKSSRDLESQAHAAMDILNDSLLTNEKLRTKLKSLQADMSNIKSMAQSVPAVYFYPRIQYQSTKKVYKIKGLTHPAFLFSFMLGFRDYLQLHKSLRPKLVVVCPVGKVHELRYSKYPWVTDSQDDLSPSVLFTNTPTASLMKDILEHPSSNTVIVCDLITTTPSHILNSNTPTFYACTGISMAKALKLPGEYCFNSTLEVPEFRFTIPKFKYPVSVDQLKRFYQDCAPYYDEILKG